VNAQDVERFDFLHSQKKAGIVLDHPTEVEFQVLLERVVLGKDGKSEFPTTDTEIVAVMRRKGYCDDIAAKLFQEALKHGPEVLAALARLLAR
jgi:uncharacterized NAD-dependent epimerase/dehydratase family protein